MGLGVEAVWWYEQGIMLVERCFLFVEAVVGAHKAREESLSGPRQFYMAC